LRELFDRTEDGDNHAAEQKTAPERWNLSHAQAGVEEECSAANQNKVTDFIRARCLLDKREERASEVSIGEIDDERNEEQPGAREQPTL
jgi:hypothetical protein